MKKVLVAYASGFGTTKEIAEDIGKLLQENGLNTEVARVESITDLSPYSGVVLGAGIRAGNLLPSQSRLVPVLKGRQAQGSFMSVKNT